MGGNGEDRRLFLSGNSSGCLQRNELHAFDGPSGSRAGGGEDGNHAGDFKVKNGAAGVFKVRVFFGRAVLAGRSLGRTAAPGAGPRSRVRHAGGVDGVPFPPA